MTITACVRDGGGLNEWTRVPMGNWGSDLGKG